MRTKEAEERDLQERTWIYLLHDQAPPTAARHVTPAVLAARSAGVLGGDAPPTPLLPSVFAPQPSPQGPSYASRDAFAPSATSNASANTPTTIRGVDAFGRPLAAARAPSAYPLPYGAGYAPRVVTANDKWRVAPPMAQQHMHHQAPPSMQQQQQLAPLRSIVTKSEKAPVYVPVVVPGPMVMKRDPTQQQLQQSTSSAVVVPAKQQAKSSGGLVGLLPKKRRLDELHEQFGATLAEDADDADEDEESKLAKRNCFPKKCDFPMCKNSSRSRGFCYSHGGGRRCRMDGCNNGAVSRDLCKRHGGGRRCRISGCKSSSESGGLCYSHGGGRRCSLSWCSARAKKGGYCAVHIDNKNAEAPSAEELAALAQQQQQTEQAETKAVVPPTVVETLLSLAQAKSSSSASSSSVEVAASSSPSASAAGGVSPTSPTLPELSTPRFSSIASLLN